MKRLTDAWQKVGFFYRKKKKLVLGVLGLLLLAVGLGASIYLVKQRQDTRSKAAFGEVVLEPNRNRMAFVSHSQRDLTEIEMQFLANNYDLIVIGNQRKPMDMEARRIKELNPDVPVLVYFPTSIRHERADYGKSEPLKFNNSWFLKDIYGNYLTKGSTGMLKYVDLTRNDYISWAKRTVNNILRQAEYDGVVFDNANPMGAVPISKEANSERLGLAKLEAWDLSQFKYVRNMTTTMNNQGKILIYNGIARLPSKLNRNQSYLGISNGALNEQFCYEHNRGRSGIFSKEMQLEDIDLQLKIGKQGKYVLQKVNWHELKQLEQDKQDRYGRYCYGVFMMGHVPDFTYFKFGEGYNLVQAPDEYKTNALEVGVGMGRPLGDYKRTGWLLNRVFEKGYVVTNLGTNSASWRAPEKLELWNGGMYLRTVDKGNQYLIGPQDASFFLKPDEGKGGQSPLPEPLPAVSPSPEASLEPSPSLEPEMSCRDYCIEVEGRQDGGWCAYQASNCAVNGGEYFSSGDAYCEESRSCCCKSDQAPVLTCRQYCQNQGYDRGWCAFKPANCEPAGGKYYSDGDEYCSADRSNCCCRND